MHKGEFFETPVGLRKAQLPAATGDTEKYPGARQLPGGTGSTVILTAELETPLRAAESAFRAALAKRNEQLALTKAAIIELAERTSEAGLYAREMQILIGETRFDAWFSERKFACSLAQAKAFIRFSERREKLSDSFWRTLLALPEVAEKREDGEQKKLRKPPCPWLSAIMKAIEAVNLAKEHVPLESWPEAHRITLQDSLRPFVELHHKLKKLCED